MFGFLLFSTLLIIATSFHKGLRGRKFVIEGGCTSHSYLKARSENGFVMGTNVIVFTPCSMRVHDNPLIPPPDAGIIWKPIFILDEEFVAELALSVSEDLKETIDGCLRDLTISLARLGMELEILHGRVEISIPDYMKRIGAVESKKYMVLSMNSFAMK